MKKQAPVWCAALLGALIVAPVSGAEPQSFSLSGCLQGAAAGDTLRFWRVAYPGYERTEAFVAFTDQNGRFDYRGTQPHASMYLMQYAPVDGKAPEQDRMGQELFVRAGDRLTLDGVRQQFAFCTVEGGVYAHPLLRQAVAIRDSLGAARSALLQQRTQASERGDVAAAKAYGDAFNAFRSGEAGRRADSLERLYVASPDASELAAVRLLGKASYTDPTELSAEYEKLSSAVRQSYHGLLLGEQVALALSLLPGRPAPEFTLTAPDGSKITLGDFKGRHLLVYHWGGCPGSMQADPRVRELYQKTDRAEWSVVGVTSTRADVQKMHDQFDSTVVLFGMKLKERTGEMLMHPYPDYDLTQEGNDIDKRYLFGGLPFFVLISPQGTILARGFHEALEEAHALVRSDKK